MSINPNQPARGRPVEVIIYNYSDDDTWDDRFTGYLISITQDSYAIELCNGLVRIIDIEDSEVRFTDVKEVRL